MNPLLLGMMVGAFAGFAAAGIIMAVLAAAARETPKPRKRYEGIACEDCDLYLTPWKCNGGTEEFPCPNDAGAREATR